MDTTASPYSFYFNGTNDLLYEQLTDIYYNKYVFFAVCSALVGLPSNILLLVILMRIGLFSRRRSSASYLTTKPTGSFERFLFEVVVIDTLLIIYHFIDNFLSYIHNDRTGGQHYLIHVSDFCCKIFTYIAKMSVLLTTWLFFFLIINQLILTMEYNNNNNRSFWNRGLYYVNAKYSTVFLIFIFSVYNIYPIEVLKYQQKEDLPDYQVDRVLGLCYSKLEGKSKKLLSATNYGYDLLGVAIPCVIIFVISMIIIYRTCRNNKYTNKDSSSFHYIAATIGIAHALFNLPGRFSDILLMSLPPYVSFFPHLINFNHEAKSFISLSYGYKFFICILISRRFRLHAKSVLCFLIENKYEDRYTTEIVNTSNDWQQLSRRRKHKKKHRHGRESYLSKIPSGKTTLRKFPFSHINRDDLQRFTTSEATYWIRPYFTQNEKRQLIRPCGRSASCHQISTPVPSLSSDIIELPKKLSSNELNKLSTSHIINVTLPNGEYIHLPLPQKRARKYRSSSSSPSLIKNSNGPSSYENSLKATLVSEDVEKQQVNSTHFLLLSYLH